MVMDIRTLIIIVLIIVFASYCIISTHKYNNLKEEFTEYVSKDTVDIYALENERLKQKIETLQEDLNICYNTLDSLKHVKQQIIIQETFKESDNIIEGVRILKDNLRWERQ